MQRKTISLVTIVAMMLVAATSFAENFAVSGSGRVRYTTTNNYDQNKKAKDEASYMSSRFRVGFNFTPNENVSVFFEPTFAQTWGTTGFSGATTNENLDIYQAYFNYKFGDGFNFKAGIQELAYGDELLLGKVGYSDEGRTYDAWKVGYAYGMGKTDLFVATITDTKTTKGSEKTLLGLYNMWDLGEYLKNFDLYVLQLSDKTSTPDTGHTSYGVRVKSAMDALDYRAEITMQTVKAVDPANSAKNKNYSENQMDFEVGYTFMPENKARVAVEYASASKYFDQIAPTGHKWLGYMDIFSRKNITDIVVHLSSNFGDKFYGMFDYHMFSRTTEKESGTLLAAGGTTLAGNTAGKNAIGNEMDLTAGYKADENFDIKLTVGQFTPGDYMKIIKGDKNDPATYVDLEFVARF